jgi:hypothetical protein
MAPSMAVNMDGGPQDGGDAAGFWSEPVRIGTASCTGDGAELGERRYIVSPTPLYEFICPRVKCVSLNLVPLTHTLPSHAHALSALG